MMFQEINDFGITNGLAKSDIGTGRLFPDGGGGD